MPATTNSTRAQVNSRWRTITTRNGASAMRSMVSWFATVRTGSDTGSLGRRERERGRRASRRPQDSTAFRPRLLDAILLQDQLRYELVAGLLLGISQPGGAPFLRKIGRA